MEHPGRAIAKALSYRILGSFCTVLAVWAISGRLDLAGITGLIDMFVKIVAYYAHERLWERIPFGRRLATEAVDGRRAA